MNRIYPDSFMALAKVSEKFLVVDPPPVRGAEDCANCGGIGHMYYWNITGGAYRTHPGRNATYVEGEGWYAGELVGEPCPVCNGDEQTEFLRRVCGLEGADLEIRLDNFKALPGKDEARTHAGFLLSQTPAPTGFVTLYGDYGVGKTTLLKALVNGFRLAGVVARYARMTDILDEVRATFGNDAKNAAAEVVRLHRDIRVLCVDEVDRVYLTDWAVNVMFALLDDRYTTMGKRLTVMATNSAPDELDPKLEYLASRMQAGVITQVGGADVRPAIGLKNRKDMEQ